MSKLGDYRAPHRGKPHRISVNKDLNSYAFLITYLHELAHLIVHENYKHKAKPHGAEWKQTFQVLLSEVFGKGIFPNDLEEIIVVSMRNLKANTCTDSKLTMALRRYDEDSDIIWLNDIPDKTTFSMRNGRVFKKGKKQRTRYRCLETKSNRIYLIHGMAEVKRIA